MRRGNYLIYLLTVLLAVTALYFWSGESQYETAGPVCAVVDTAENRQTIACWESESGDYYVFLPAEHNNQKFLYIFWLQLHPNYTS